MGEAAGHSFAAVRHKVRLKESRNWIVPICECTNRNAAADFGIIFLTTSATRGRISHRRKHTVDRCRTDGEYVLANGDVEFEMAVPFECRHKDGQQWLEPLSTYAIRGFP